MQRHAWSILCNVFSTILHLLPFPCKAYNTNRKRTTEGRTVRFTKMNGAGNDFILLDAIAEPFDESAAPRSGPFAV